MPLPDPAFLTYSDPDPQDTASRLALCERRWGVSSRGPLSGGFRSSVFDCVTAAGDEVVVKLVRHPVEAAMEAAALAAWTATGASVDLLDFDNEHAALLLERVRPGTALSIGFGAVEVAVEVAAALLGRLHVTPPPNSGFMTVAEIYDAWERRSVADNTYFRRVRSEPRRGSEGLARLPAARHAAMTLSASAATTVLLHGDFIDKNLLLDGTGYIAIDPIPRIGDACSDIGFFAAGRPPVAGILDLAAAIAARLGADPLRAQRWAAVWAIHQTVQAWRRDQKELEAFAAGHEVQRLLDG